MDAIVNELRIVTPTHKERLSEGEIAKITQSLQFNLNICHDFVVPESNDSSNLKSYFPDSNIIRMRDSFFDSIKSYNRLMLSEYFYNHFLDSKYLLILQTDAILLRGIKNSDFHEYDYLGAPWQKNLRVTMFRGDLHANNKRLLFAPFKIINVGNGGLSFRNVFAILDLLKSIDYQNFHPRIFDGSHNEDFILSYFMKKRKYRVPTKSEARKIFIEEDFAKCIEIPNVLGVHAPEKYNEGLADRLLLKV